MPNVETRGERDRPGCSFRRPAGNPLAGDSLSLGTPSDEYGFRFSGFALLAAPKLPSVGGRPSALGLRPSLRAFTLVEMLVVIAIIGILASLIFPVTKAVARARIRSSAKAQLAQIQTAIEEYKTKLGYYPPDNPIKVTATSTNYAVNQLYYELEGTTGTASGANTVYQTLNGAAQISSGSFQAGFVNNPPVVNGFMNSAKGAASDDVQSAVNFFKDLKAAQFLTVTVPNATASIVVLGTSLSGPLMYTGTPSGKINAWRYNSSNPANNAGSYDLWIDVSVSGVTNRICNWSPQALIVAPVNPGGY